MTQLGARMGLNQDGSKCCGDAIPPVASVLENLEDKGGIRYFISLACLWQGQTLGETMFLCFSVSHPLTKMLNIPASCWWIWLKLSGSDSVII